MHWFLTVARRMLPFMVVLAALASPARAGFATCNGADAPGTYDEHACDAGGLDICTEDITDTIVCDLVLNGDGTASWMVAVTQNASGSHDFSFYGADGDGNSFCCAYDEGASEITAVNLRGTNYSDTIGADDLSNNGGSDGFTLTILGFGGNDILVGSDTGIPATYLWGYAGDDVLTSPGDDAGINGCSGSDQLFGGDYADTMYGGSGGGSCGGGTDLDDRLYGGPGADYLDGDDDDDLVWGEAGDDVMRGSTGADILCGGENADDMDGQGDDDVMWGDQGTDNAQGGGGTNFCSAEVESSCTHIYTIPEECEPA